MTTDNQTNSHYSRFLDLNKIEDLVNNIISITDKYLIKNNNLKESIKNLIRYSSSIEDVDIHPGISAAYKSFAFANTYNFKIYNYTQDKSSINMYYVLNMIAIAIISYNGFTDYTQLENIADRLYLETNPYYGYYEHLTYGKMEEQLMDNMLNTDCRIVSTYLILKHVLINTNYIIPYNSPQRYKNYRIEHIYNDVYFVDGKLLFNILESIIDSIGKMPIELYNCSAFFPVDAEYASSLDASSVVKPATSCNFAWIANWSTLNSTEVP
jgi:hypothetical protein